jgi:DNA polymerase elongation subunit (family B)
MHYSEFRAESQITGIAWSWVGEDTMYCAILEQDLSNEREMFQRFMDAFNQADMLTGHYIRRHDLPLIVDHCARLGLPIPRPVRVQDTKVDLVRMNGMGQSQENLSTTFGLAAEKHHMCGASWRVANALTPEGQAGTRKRVVDDVIQHKAMRAELLKRGMLKAPKMWRA